MTLGSTVTALRARVGRRGLAVFLGVCLLLVQQTLHVGADDILGYALNDAMHVPLFVLLTLLMGWLLPGWSLWRLAAAVLVIAAASEMLQAFTERDASLRDLALDAAGIAVAASAMWFYRRRPPEVGHGLTVVLGVAVMVVTVAVAAAEPVRIMLARASLAANFPTLLPPESGLDGPLIVTRSRWRVVQPPPSWTEVAGRPVLEVVWADQRHPDIVLLEVVPGWEGFEELVADVLVPDGDPVTFTARLHYDDEAEGASSWLWRIVPQGAHRVRFPLDELLLPDHGRIGRLVLHVGNEDVGRTILLGPVRLEGRADAAGSGSAQGR